MGVTSLSDQPLPPELDIAVDRLIDAALAQRPDLAAMVAEVRAKQAAVARAQDTFYPTLSVDGNVTGDLWRYRINDSEARFTAEPANSGLLNLEWAAFLGNERENRLRAARARADGAKAALEEAGLGAITEVWRAYYRVLAVRKQYAYAEALLRASEDAYQATLESYVQGLNTIVQLLDGERDLAQARYAVVETRAGLLTDTAALAYAAGYTHGSAHPSVAAAEDRFHATTPRPGPPPTIPNRADQRTSVSGTPRALSLGVAQGIDRCRPHHRP